jgi:chloride channel protein, CIC family
MDHNGIPISISLEENINNAAGSESYFSADKKRLVYISFLAIVIGCCISVIAKALVLLINLITNISFYHRFATAAVAPGGNHYGLWVIVVPAIGGVFVGLMALYGSKAIRGHGIPEAMEQILVNNSRIRPSITYLKPLSSAISIGTGGPFGAEGPIIATGGALGSTIGQILKISSQERKVLLAAGATAGMSAIFGSPVAAIFLAIELLLFEFSPRSIIPVTLACITAAAGHHIFFEAGPVFPMPHVDVPTNLAMAVYSIIGIIMGLASAMITKIVYFIEDAFEKLPVHWMWWPAIGGLLVGLVGYFAPRTLGVGYDNITDLLSGKMTLMIIVNLCVMKFLSWSVALGSGTSGGTLAPLLTIGGAMGILLGLSALHFFPASGVVLTLSALVGMSAMFAGASRALLTSILFAIETTGQSSALLPLLAACIASYVISYFLMENTIMTEKIARRGVRTPHSYQPDILEKLNVQHVIKSGHAALNSEQTLQQAREKLLIEKDNNNNYYILAGKDGSFRGIISKSSLFSMHHAPTQVLETLIKRKSVAVTNEDSLKTAVEIMAKENIDVLPVVTKAGNKVTGILSYKDVLAAYRHQMEEHKETVAISIRKKTKQWMARRRR